MTPAPRTPTAAFFDLDKTVISRSSTLAFTKPFYEGGLLTRTAMLRSAIAQLQFLLTSADDGHTERLRKHVTDMCHGWNAEQVRAIVTDTLDTVVRPVIFEEASELIAEHKAAGRDVVLISASGIEMVEPIGDVLGVDIVRASKMVIVDGCYSGELEFYCYGDEKAVAINELAAERGYDLAGSYAYSDSITDLPMLDLVGHAAVVNPDTELRAVAEERGWGVLEFANPKPYVSPRTVRITLRATVITAAAVALAVTGYVRHRRRRRAARP